MWSNNANFIKCREQGEITQWELKIETWRINDQRG